MDWIKLPESATSFGPAIVGWAGSPQVVRAFFDGVDWFAIGPNKDGGVRESGSLKKLTERPTHYLPERLIQEIWGAR